MLTRVLRAVPFDAISGRSKLGVYMRRLRQHLVDQLGGEENVTPTQMLLVEEAVKKAAIVEAVGNHVLTRASLVNEGRDGLLAIVQQHDQLQLSLAKLLALIGWERKRRSWTCPKRPSAPPGKGSSQPCTARLHPQSHSAAARGVLSAVVEALARVSFSDGRRSMPLSKVREKYTSPPGSEARSR